MLSVGPMTGYDLLQHFDRSAAFIWAASQGQIYPELRTMESEGLLSAETALRGKRAEKRVYSVTRKGVEELHRWVGAPIAYPQNKDPVLLKVSYLDMVDLERARPLFEAHVAHYEMRLKVAEEQLKTLRAGRMRRESIRDAAGHAAMLAFRKHVVESLIRTATAEIDWGRRGMKIVDRLRREARTEKKPVRKRARS